MDAQLFGLVSKNVEKFRVYYYTQVGLKKPDTNILCRVTKELIYRETVQALTSQKP